jgi:hypothetical protein
LQAGGRRFDPGHVHQPTSFSTTFHLESNLMPRHDPLPRRQEVTGSIEVAPTILFKNQSVDLAFSRQGQRETF